MTAIPLALGDQDYRFQGSEPNYANSYQSKTPFSFLVSNALRQAYHYAQSHSRLLLCQNYSFNNQLVRGEASSFEWSAITGDNEMGVARGWARIPRQTNAIRTFCIYGVIGVRAIKVRHDVFIYNHSASSGFSASVEKQIDVRSGAQAGGIQGAISDFFPHNSFANAASYVDRDEVLMEWGDALSVEPGISGGVPHALELRITATAQARGILAGAADYTQEALFYPLAYLMFAEMRYG